MIEQKGNAEKEAKQGRIEFSFPLLTVRTPLFTGVFDRLGSLRASRWISWVALAIVPIVAGIGFYVICSSLFTVLWNPAARDITRALGPQAYLLLPGINPLVPIVYGWIALIGAIAVHEGAHGIIARNRGFTVRSSGLLFFLVLPIGAFVDVDEEQLTRAKAREALRVLAAGVGGNIMVALACVLGVLVIVSGLTPVIDGVYILDVTEGMPAEAAGLWVGDVMVSLDDIAIAEYEDLRTVLARKNPGDLVPVTVARGDRWATQFSTSVTLTEADGRAVMGVEVGDLRIEERLRFYQTLTPDTLPKYLMPPAFTPGLVPFSDALAPFYTHILGNHWHVWANVLFWLWFFNVNIAVFNALPIYPLDGGRIFHIALKRVLGQRWGEKTVDRITFAVAGTLLSIFLLIAVLPFIM